MLTEDLPLASPPLLHHLCTINISEDSDWEDARIVTINNVLIGEDKREAQNVF